MNEDRVVVKGTIAELLAQGVTANGHLLDSAQLSVLTRLFGKEIGVVPKVGRGRKASMWELGSTFDLGLSVAIRTLTVPSKPQESEYTAPAATVEMPEANVAPQEPAPVKTSAETEDTIKFPWDTH